MVLITNFRQKPYCGDCQMRWFEEVTDPKMKKMFDIDIDLYKENSFLRDIRLKYQRFEELSPKQIEVFKKVAKEAAEQKGKPKEEAVILGPVYGEEEKPKKKGRKKKIR